MKRNSDNSNDTGRISRRGTLPLLRGMFVGPGSSVRNEKPARRKTDNFNASDDELVLTADKGYFLGL